ncbi:hypothetical protein ACFL5C_01690 [Candidatus Omnitrophota bacterium]
MKFRVFSYSSGFLDPVYVKVTEEECSLKEHNTYSPDQITPAELRQKGLANHGLYLKKEEGGQKTARMIKKDPISHSRQ